MLDLYSLYLRTERLYTDLSRYLPNGYSLPPLQMVFEVTYRCTLKCGFCYQRKQMEQLDFHANSHRQELSYDEISHFIDQTPPWCLIIFSGGEPFVRSDILDILAYAARKRRCHVVTNGTRISADIAKTLVDLKVLSVGFSIDGDQPTHDRMRGVPGTFNRVMGAISLLRHYRKEAGRRWPLVNLKTTITSSNVHDLGHVFEVAKQTGADYCTYQIENTSVLISGLQLNNRLDRYFLSPEPFREFDLETLRQQLYPLKKANSRSSPKIRFSPSIPFSEMLAHYANQLDVRSYTCRMPWSGVNVSPYGDVFPCFNYRIGSLRRNTLRSLWNGRRYRHFRQMLKRHGLFGGCVGCCDLAYLGGDEPKRESET